MRVKFRCADGRSVFLTEREIECVGMWLLGYSQREVARQLSISWHTVRAHINHVKCKLGTVNGRDTAMCFARMTRENSTLCLSLGVMFWLVISGILITHGTSAETLAVGTPFVTSTPRPLIIYTSYAIANQFTSLLRVVGGLIIGIGMVSITFWAVRRSA